jgi:ribosomal protein S18 acetylase RimI-like enzyme
MIRAVSDADVEMVRAFARDRWGADVAVSQGRIHQLDQLPGFVALTPDGRVAGLVTYLIEGDSCEVVSIDAVDQGQGTGTALLARAVEAARSAGCRQVRLVTTNDNLRALRFYQRGGFRLIGLNPGAVEHSRRLKPQIPAIGAHGIPLRDELLLGLDL